MLTHSDKVLLPFQNLDVNMEKIRDLQQVTKATVTKNHKAFTMVKTHLPYSSHRVQQHRSCHQESAMKKILKKSLLKQFDHLMGV